MKHRFEKQQKHYIIKSRRNMTTVISTCTYIDKTQSSHALSSYFMQVFYNLYFIFIFVNLSET